MSDTAPKTADRTAALIATVVAALMIAAQVAGKATRDAYFLSLYPASDLPSLIAASAAISLAAVLIFARAMTRFSPAHVVPIAFGVNAALFVGEWALSLESPRIAAVAVYLHTASLGATVISSFWSMINERFDPHTARRAMSGIAAGSTFGGVIGGVAAWTLAGVISLHAMLLVLASLAAVAAVASTRIGRPHALARPKQSSESGPSGLKVLGEMPYLRQLALLVMLVAFGEATIDYVFKADADARFVSDETLVTFFAVFHMSTAVAAFGLQTTLAKKALAAIGLAGTVAFLPAVVVAGGVVALLFPGIWSAVALRGGAATMQNSFYRSGYELLYTPLTPEKKRPTKTLIDVGFERLGTAAGAGLLMLVLAATADRGETVLLVIAIGTALSALAIASLLHSGYVSALADSLRAGFVKLEAAEILDRTTHRTLSNTTMALDREKLLREIAAMRASADLGSPGAPSTPGMERASLDADDPLLLAIADLRSHDTTRIRSRLEGKRKLDPLLVPFVIPLLSRDDTIRDAIAALRVVACRATGQLVDALLDPRTDPVVRRRLPRVLSTCRNQRAADGLMEGLRDPLFEVRDWCAVALETLVERSPELQVDEDAAFAAARREAEAIPKGSARIEDRRIEHVFRVLALVLDREPMHLAYRALALDDDVLRGTGLEYLENVLPASVQSALAPHLGKRPERKPKKRPKQEIVDELLTSMTGIPRIQLPK